MKQKHDPAAMPYYCNYCLLRFKTSSAAKIHENKHDKKDQKIFVCSICAATGISKEGMEHHKTFDHRTPGSLTVYPIKENSAISFHPRSFSPADNSKYDSSWFLCNFCNKKMKPKSVILRHLEVHNPQIYPYGCHQCVARFDKEYELREHLIENHKTQEISIFSCDICGVTGNNKNGMENHMIDDHLKEFSQHPVDIFRCSYCDILFKTRRSLSVHMVNKHNESLKVKCDKCSETFTDRKDLNFHNMKDHEMLFRELESDEIEVNLKCCKCEKSHNTEDELINFHLKTHKNDFDRTKCNFCTKVLKTFHEFSEHSKFHIQPQTLICLVCKRKFPYDEKFFRHITGHKKYECYKTECEKCHQKFRSAKDLIVHDKIRHQKKTLFICPICAKSMSSSNALDQHIR